MADENIRHTGSDAKIAKRSITDVISMLGWRVMPELNIFGVDSLSKFEIVNWPNTKVEFIEEKMRAFTSALSGAIADGVATTFDVVADDGVLFRYGDVVLIEDELLFVASVATDTLTVTRGYGGTTAAAHADELEVLIATRAVEEGADHRTGHVNATTIWTNHAQILSEAIKVTKTREATLSYGIADEMDHQMAKLFDDGGKAGYLARLLAQTFYYGQPVARVNGAENGMMGGFNSRLAEIPDTNKNSLAGAAVTTTHIEDIIQGIHDNNGVPSVLLTSPWGARKVASLYRESIRTERSETVGGNKIDTITTALGDVDVAYSWLCPTSHMYFCDPSKLGWFPLRPFMRTETAEYGDRYGADVVGEYTFGMVNPEAHGRIDGMSTTA